MKNQLMKITAFTFAALLTSASAFALEPQPGAFVPAQCGVASAPTTGQTNADPVQKLCFGQVAGVQGSKAVAAVSFQLADGDSKVFNVVNRAFLANAFESGATESVISLAANDGQQAAIKVLRSHDGKIISVTGSLAGQVFTAANFKAVMVMQ